MSDREEAQIALARVLLDKIRTDSHPSITQMNLLEEFIPRPIIREYFNVLLEKVLSEQWPSNSMLARLVQVADAM